MIWWAWLLVAAGLVVVIVGYCVAAIGSESEERRG